METLPASPPRLYPIRFQPLLFLAAPFLAGIALADHLPGALVWVLPLLLILTGITILILEQQWRWFFAFKNWHKANLPLSPAWLLLAMAFGFVRFSTAQPAISPHQLAYYNDRGKAEIIGFIADSPQQSEHSTQFTLKAISIQQPAGGDHSPWLQITGKMQVITQGTKELHYGERVSIYCEPQTPETLGEFNYPRWLAARHIYTQCMFASVYPLEGNHGNILLRGIYSLRNEADHKITALLPAEEAALLSGILLGLENEIPPETEQAFKRSGTSHIIAISGANFTLLVSFMTIMLLRFLPRRWSLPITIGMVMLYTIFVGGNPAVLRAALMGIMTFGARFIGRKNQGLNSLAFSAAFLCGINPLLLWDLSFQLSALATLGLVLFAAPLQYHFTRLVLKVLPESLALKASGYLSEYLLMSLAAQVFTLPLIAYHFHTISLSSILANLLVLPVQPLIMALGGLTVVFGLILTPLGQFFGWLAGIPLAYTLRIVTWIGGWRWGFWTIDRFSPGLLLLYLLFVTAIPLLQGWMPHLRRKISSATMLLLAGLCLIVLWNTALQQPDGDFHLNLPDLPENDAIIIRLPDRNALLIGRSSAIDSLERTISPLLAGYDLEVICLPGSQSSDLDSMEELILRYQPSSFLYSTFLPSTGILALEQKTHLSGTAFQRMATGMSLQTDSSFQIHLLAVREEGAALQIIYHNLRFLIPGGIGFSELTQLSEKDMAGNTILILTDRDLARNDHAAWYSLPVQAILLSGGGDECPSPHCRSTKQFGNLEVRSDGAQFWITGE